MHVEFQKLLDMKVAYEKCLKELEAECKRNDYLIADCKAAEKLRNSNADTNTES